MRGLRVGTRASKLARAQTQIVVDILCARFPELDVEVVPVTTLGDRLPEEKRAEVEGKGAFTEDLETLLQKGKLDIAVHSMKDLPTELGRGLKIGATPVRGDPRDALVSRDGLRLAELPVGAVVGTSSVRRKAQLRALKKDLNVTDLHGNVETRLRKMTELGLAGIVIAAAGLERVGEARQVAEFFSVDDMVPAPCQGTIALEIRANDAQAREFLEVVDDPKTRAESSCERSFALRLGGDCDVPAGAYAISEGSRMKIVGAVLSPDGVEVVRRTLIGGVAHPEELGKSFAETLLESGGMEILRSVA